MLNKTVTLAFAVMGALAGCIPMTHTLYALEEVRPRLINSTAEEVRVEFRTRDSRDHEYAASYLPPGGIFEHETMLFRAGDPERRPTATVAAASGSIAMVRFAPDEDCFVLSFVENELTALPQSHGARQP